MGKGYDIVQDLQESLEKISNLPKPKSTRKMTYIANTKALYEYMKKLGRNVILVDEKYKGE